MGLYGGSNFLDPPREILTLNPNPKMLVWGIIATRGPRLEGLLIHSAEEHVNFAWCLDCRGRAWGLDCFGVNKG